MLGKKSGEYGMIIKEEKIMLVLGMKPGEYVMIGEDIMVKVIKSDFGDFRLAIDAPKNLIISRGELYEKTKKSTETS